MVKLPVFGRITHRWVLKLRETGSVIKRKSTDRPRTVRIPENVKAVGVAVH